jgi:hypothetical protein
MPSRASKSHQRLTRRKLKRARLTEHPDARRVHPWKWRPGSESRWQTAKWKGRRDEAA